MRVSVIIPVGPGESPDAALFSQLHMLPDSWQVIIALCPDTEFLKSVLSFDRDVLFVTAQRGRGLQMNAAVQRAGGQYLWFLHMDSVLTPSVVSALDDALEYGPDKLLCYRLRFAPDGRGPMGLNAFGANLRTYLLGVPFGDQGLCLKAERFREVGGYPVAVPYGEDHVLVWELRLVGVGVTMLPCELETSARKYRRAGWLNLTLRYQWYWLKQAAPYVVCLLKQKLKRLIG